jgi:DNA repair protein RecO (recombination protein O)
VALYRDNGIVLRTYKLAEADRIGVLLTEHHGKVRAVAKGVRKATSKLGGRVEPGTHYAAMLFEGRGDLHRITQLDVIDAFHNIRNDYDRLTRMGAVLEVAEQLSQDHEPNEALYRMVLGVLRTLDERDSAVLVGAFYWKALALEGFRPELDICVGCGADPSSDPDVELIGFDVVEGVLCRSCRRGQSISADALGVLRLILGGQLGAALNEPESSVTHEIEGLATRAMEHHLERRLRAGHLLDRA